MNKPNRKPKPKRRTAPLTVESQLMGKLGPTGYGRLLDALGRVTKRAA